MDRNEFDPIERDARIRRAREMRCLAVSVLRALARLLAPSREAHADVSPSPAERFMGLASFQDRLKNSRPPRIAFIRSISRSKCSGTSTKLRRSLLTMSSGLSE